jgi:hypothetical protein
MVLGGLRVEQVAGVHAAVAEEIPLGDVLAQENIDPGKWPGAERAWREAIADSPDLQMNYARRRREAEDALTRETSPLADDAAAWMGLLAVVTVASDPNAILTKLGLRSTDFGRLGRVWRKKAEDPEVAKKLTELAGKAPAPQSVKVEPSKLAAFPWSPGSAKKGEAVRGAQVDGAPASAPATTARLSTPVAGVLPVASDIDLYAALAVVIELAPQAKSAALALCGIDAKRHAEIAKAWAERLEDPNVRAAYTVTELDHRAIVQRMLAGAKPRLA